MRRLKIGFSGLIFSLLLRLLGIRENRERFLSGKQVAGDRIHCNYTMRAIYLHIRGGGGGRLGYPPPNVKYIAHIWFYNIVFSSCFGTLCLD